MQRFSMKKPFAIFLSAVCFTFIFCGCSAAKGEDDLADDTKRNSKSSGSEVTEDSAEDLFGEWPVKDVVQYQTFDEFIENCPDDLKAVMAEFPVEDFEQVQFFTAPDPVIIFTDNGEKYYFSGSEGENIFSAYYTLYYGLLVYSGIHTGASATMISTEISGPNCLLRFEDSDCQFALTADTSVGPEVYFNVLSKATGDEYKCTENDNVRIDGELVEVGFDSYEMPKPNYVLSEPGVLKEITCEFEPEKEGEIVSVGEGEAIGSYYSGAPAKLRLVFEAAESGRTTLEILGEQDRVLYCVNIEVDSDKGALIDASEALADFGFYEARLSIDTSGLEREAFGEYSLDSVLLIRLETYPALSSAVYGKEDMEARIKELEGDDIRIISLELSDGYAEGLTYPAWIIEYEWGHNEDTALCTDVYIQTDTNEYRVNTRVAADWAEDYQDEIERRLETITLS